MSLAQPAVGEPARTQSGASRRATVFGLDVRANVGLPFLVGASAQPTGRTLELRVARKSARAPIWPGGTELVCDQQEGDGSPSFRIESHPAAGYRISGPRYGVHILSADGGCALCLPDSCPPSAWQRFLVAQVLPFAALLGGLEVLHASAVVTHRGAVALSGPRGPARRRWHSSCAVAAHASWRMMCWRCSATGSYSSAIPARR